MFFLHSWKFPQNPAVSEPTLKVTPSIVAFTIGEKNAEQRTPLKVTYLPEWKKKISFVLVPTA